MSRWMPSQVVGSLRPRLDGLRSLSRPRLSTLAGLAAVFGLALALRLYALDALPGEWYGDVTLVHIYVQDILAGRWPVAYNASLGPLYHYLIAPLIALWGDSYIAYKLASAVISLPVIGVTMLLGYELGGRRLALVTGLVAAMSSWLLVFSRLGVQLVVIPLLTALLAYIVVRFARANSFALCVVGAMVSVLGFYAYPQTFILPGLFVLLLLVYLKPPRRPRVFWLVDTVLIIAVGAIPLAVDILTHRANFETGYVGSKLFGAGQLSLTDLAVELGRNLLKTALMLHVRGDHVFRSNPPYVPHLDPVSGAFFLLGLLAFLRRDLRRFIPLLVLSLVVLSVPGSWPYLPSVEIPSASRTIGLVPLLYLLVAVGLVAVYDALKRIERRGWLALAVVSLSLVAMLALNSYRYFVAYAWNLPYHNTPFGRRIAEDMQTLPEDALIYVVGCCWGAWSQPEVEGIRYALPHPPPMQFVGSADDVCREPATRYVPVYVYLNPNDDAAVQALRQCAPTGVDETRFSGYGDAMYRRYHIPNPTTSRESPPSPDTR